MKPTSDVHAETVALVSDAVAAITERAVRPALAPFQQELRKLTTGLDQKINEIDDLVREDQEERKRLLREVGQLGAEQDARLAALADSNRGWHEALRRVGEHLTVLHQSMRGLEAAYAQSDRNHREDARRLGEHLAALTQAARGLEAALAYQSANSTAQVGRLRTLTVRWLVAVGGLTLAASAALGLVVLLS